MKTVGRLASFGALSLAFAGCAADASQDTQETTAALTTPLTDADADAATNSLFHQYWVPGEYQNQFWETFRNAAPAPFGATCAHVAGGACYWVIAQALDALVDAAGRNPSYWSDVDTVLTGAEHSYTDLKTGFYDDEAWMALALAHAYEAKHDSRFLCTATSIYRFIKETGFSYNSETHKFAGVWWQDYNFGTQSTASNFPVAMVAAILARYPEMASCSAHVAGQIDAPTLHNDARMIYGYWRNEMTRPAHGGLQVADCIRLSDVARTETVDGHHVALPELHCLRDPFMDAQGREWAALTYDNGVAIGAAFEVFRTEVKYTPNPTQAEQDTLNGYLDDAHAYADFMLKSSEVEDDVLDDPSPDGNTDLETFKGIAFRYLAMLYVHDRARAPALGAPYLPVLKTSALAIWNKARGRTNLFSWNWNGPGAAEASLNAQASAVMALNIAVTDGLTSD